ncbi:hypothetical protein [Yersinia intermedia]|uniref:hypothetical protein n=1 Tax=Yersinia intermedia TaxID=631 RepID=UPI001643D0EA|nr:hypothetical protein [Yersinia intermedia]
MRVRSIGCALSALNLPAPITPISSDNYLTCQLELRGSARRRHVLRVRSVGCALSALNLPAPITPISSDNYLICQLELRGSARRRHVLRVRSVGCAAFRTQSACADNANFL